MSYLARLAARAQPGGTLLEPSAPVPGGEPEEVETAAEPLALQRPQPMPLPRPDSEPRPLEPSAPLAVPAARLDPPRAVTVEASAPSPAQSAAAAPPPPPPAATRQEVAQPPAAAPLRPVAPAQAAPASERRPPAPVAEFAASSKHARVEDAPAPTPSGPHELLVSKPAAVPMRASAPMSPTAPAARAAPTERVVLVPAVADPVAVAPAPPDERPRLVIGRLEVEVVPQEPPAAAPRRAVQRRVSAAPPAARRSSLRFGLGQI